MKHFLFILAFAATTVSLAQSDAAAFNRIILNDTSELPALFSKPDSIRKAILTASTFPEGFTRLNEIQKSSSSAFRNLVSKYDRSDQKELWDISRYPGLLSALVQNKGKSEKELEDLLKAYPEKIRKWSIAFSRKHYDTLAEMKKINDSFDAQYQQAAKAFPREVRQSFQVLLNDPATLSLLTENIRTTIALGDLYRRNPALTSHLTDSLHQDLEIKYKSEYEDWKKGIGKDTSVQRELKHVADTYSGEDDYPDDVYVQASEAEHSSNPSVNQESGINPAGAVLPYPYWAGYPYWLGYDYWYPYPWWIEMGLYWPMSGHYVFLGLPRYHFGWWYYNHPRYYSNHPHASDYFNDHYMRHRNTGFNSGFNRSVHQFSMPRGGGGGIPRGGRR